METIDKDINTEDIVGINSQIKTHLKETAKWANFLAIVGFVMLGLLLIGSLFMFGAGTMVGGSELSMLGLVYIAMVALYFFPTFYLFNFAKKIKTGLNSSSQSDVEVAFENLKKMFKFMGILMIIVLAFYALAILIGLLAGISSFF